jgi:hypothetical protein
MRHTFEWEHHDIVLVKRMKISVVKRLSAVRIEIHEAPQSQVMQDALGIGKRKGIRNISLPAEFDRCAKRGVFCIHYARLLKHRPALRNGFVEWGSTRVLLKENRLDLHAAGQRDGLSALAATAVKMQDAVRVAMQVEHDVVLQRFRQ